MNLLITGVTSLQGGAPATAVVRDGDDSWISQSASFPRNQKLGGVDSPSPAPSLPKPQGQSSSTSPAVQPPPRTVKVTCANCKKPLKKGQTAYQRKGSTHLFCSTTCLSAFSHKPAPKKTCTMCKKCRLAPGVRSLGTELAATTLLEMREWIRHEVSFKTVTHKICSDTCFNVYRMANGLIMNCCEQCGDYLPSRATANHALLVDGPAEALLLPQLYQGVQASGTGNNLNNTQPFVYSHENTQATLGERRGLTLLELDCC
ncbi:hypothetical protein CRUP_026981 [Coryphaenoides rupestris]|nr:hypothetical protein CRUP_026981 [Coryphaenoides rupestris]